MGSEFRANTYTSNDQVYSSVTALNDGGFVVTWSSTARTAAAMASTASAMRRTAAPAGSEFRANTYTTNDQVYSSVTALNDGGFVVTWSSDGQDGSGYGIYGQRYAADGTPVGSEFAINQITSGNQFAGDVLWLRDVGDARRRPFGAGLGRQWARRRCSFA